MYGERDGWMDQGYCVTRMQHDYYRRRRAKREKTGKAKELMTRRVDRLPLAAESSVGERT